MMANRNSCPYCHYTVGHAETCELILGAKTLTEAETAVAANPAALEAVAAAIAPAPAPEILPPIPGKSFVEALQQTQAEMTDNVRARLDALTNGAKVDEGVKFDEDKIRHDLLPTDALDEIGRVLTFGANKYGDRNWERGMKWGRILGAALRHAFAIMRGEDHDAETGLLHSAHLATCAMFLCSFQLRNLGTDDRKPLPLKG